MKIANTKLKKAIIISIAAIILAVAVVIIFISPITKYLVEKYDEKYTGRQITMSWAYVNPFTGYVYFSNYKIYEEKSDSIALSGAGLSGKFKMLKMFGGTTEINELTFDHPIWNIIQYKKEFNFMSFIKALTPKNPDTTKPPSSFNILKIKIKNGEFHYLQKEIPVNYFIKNVNIESNGKLLDADTVEFKFSFLSGPGSGSVKGDLTVNFNSLDYHYSVIVHDFDLAPLEQYLKDIANYGTFRAKLEGNITAVGNFSDEEDVTAHGQLTVNDFHFGKNKNDDYASFEKLAVAIIEISPKNKKYLFDSVSLNHPYLKYERYDYLDNVATMFGINGANIYSAEADATKFNLVIEIARYVKVLVYNFFQSYYKINRLAIYKGDLKYNDYSISEKFSMDLNPLSVFADSIDKNHKRVEIYFKSGIQPYGDAVLDLSINPQDSSDFDMQYKFQNLSAPLFNPYIISETSFPLDRGTIEAHGKWNVRNGMIQSENHLLVIDPRATKRIKNENNNWIPLWLVLAFIREKGNVIDYEIPITGNLKSPKFHLRDVIFDVLKNIFVKPVTTPYRTQVKNIEREIEKSLTLKWQMRHHTLHSNQEKYIERMADWLAKNPDASIAVYPQQYATKEKEYILFFEVKKKYFLLTNNINAQSFSIEDSEKVDKMSVKDSLFVRYLNKQINDSLVFTIQEKCSRIISSAIINSKFEQLNKERETAFIFYFKEKGVDSRVKINAAENIIPYNGFSFYKIDYKGEFPEKLLKAYGEINELNEVAPREKFKKERKKNSSKL